MNRWVAAVLLVLAVACSGKGSDSVTPAPSPLGSEAQVMPTRIAVVLPPRASITDEEANDLRIGVQRVVARADVAVELRVVQPDGPEFVTDAASVLAADGYDLVCVLGAAAAEAVVAAAADLPGTHFCVDADGALEPTPNVWAPRPRYAEAAYLVGVAAALLAGDGVVGVIVREGEPALNVKSAALADGHAEAVAQQLPDAELVSPVVGTLSLQEENVGPVVEAILSQEPSVVVVDAGPLRQAVVTRVAEQSPSSTIIEWIDSDTRDTELPRVVVVSRDRLTVFRLALEAMLGGTFADLPATVGLAEGVHTIRAASTEQPIPVLDRLNAWVEGIVRGDIDVTGSSNS